MNNNLKIMLMNDKLDTLRETAKCRCNAVSRKLNKTIDADEYDEKVHLCCWVCCDCHTDRWESELESE